MKLDIRISKLSGQPLKNSQACPPLNTKIDIVIISRGRVRPALFIRLIPSADLSHQADLTVRLGMTDLPAQEGHGHSRIPLPLGKDRHELLLDLLWILFPDDPQPLHYPDHMQVYDNALGRLARFPEDHIGGFSADTR